jgi:hypothetical protein
MDPNTDAVLKLTAFFVIFIVVWLSINVVGHLRHVKYHGCPDCHTDLVETETSTGKVRFCPRCLKVL